MASQVEFWLLSNQLTCALDFDCNSKSVNKNILDEWADMTTKPWVPTLKLEVKPLIYSSPRLIRPII